MSAHVFDFEEIDVGSLLVKVESPLAVDAWSEAVHRLIGFHCNQTQQGQ